MGFHVLAGHHGHSLALVGLCGLGALKLSGALIAKPRAMLRPGWQCSAWVDRAAALEVRARKPRQQHPNGCGRSAAQEGMAWRSGA
eukprot:330409-Lingulodinium_polyedra.AAC.1